MKSLDHCGESDIPCRKCDKGKGHSSAERTRTCQKQNTRGDFGIDVPKERCYPIGKEGRGWTVGGGKLVEDLRKEQWDNLKFIL